MVCNLLAVVTAKLDAKDAEELYGSEIGIRALAAALVPRLGATTVDRQAASWRIAGQFQGEPFSIYVSPERIQVIAGYRVSVPDARALTEHVVERAQQLALPLAQERLVATIKATYGQLAVLSDTSQGPARVTRIRIPL